MDSYRPANMQNMLYVYEKKNAKNRQTKENK